MDRQKFIKKCLTKLGHPVININLAPAQIELAVDEAIEKFNMWHFDGYETIDFAIPSTDIDLMGRFDLSAMDGAVISISDVRRGSHDNDITKVASIQKTGNYTPPNPPTNPPSGGNFNGGGILASDPLLLRYRVASGGIDYRTWSGLNSAGGISMLPMTAMQGSSSLSHLGTGNSSTTNSRIARIVQLRSNLAEIKAVYKYQVPFEWNESTQSLSVRDIVGDSIVVTANVKVNPNVYNNTWNNEWLFRYATANIKLYWGNVLNKYSNVELLGGVVIDSNRLMREAQDEIEKLMNEAHASYAETMIPTII